VSGAQHQTVEQLQAQVALLQRELYWSQLQVQVLEEKLRQQRIKLFGPRSENLSDLQLWLLELEPSVSAEEVAAEAARPNERRKSIPAGGNCRRICRVW
jgi:Transposase C of IS166 homeodomain